MSCTVLVIDDDDMVRKSIVRMIEFFEEYNIIDVSGGKEAISVLKDNTDVDIVLLDLSMPGMSGSEVYEEISKINNDLDIIIFSGLISQNTRREFQDKGVAGILEKPFDLQVLKTKLKELCKP